MCVSVVVLDMLFDVCVRAVWCVDSTVHVVCLVVFGMRLWYIGYCFAFVLIRVLHACCYLCYAHRMPGAVCCIMSETHVMKLSMCCVLCVYRLLSVVCCMFVA